MNTAEVVELRIWGLYQEFAATHPVGTSVPESAELARLWDTWERLVVES